MKYRILEKDELIQPGDETDRCRDPWRDDAVWEPVHPGDYGEPAPDPQYPSHRIFRRLLDSDGCCGCNRPLDSSGSCTFCMGDGE